MMQEKYHHSTTSSIFKKHRNKIAAGALFLSLAGNAFLFSRTQSEEKKVYLMPVLENKDSVNLPILKNQLQKIQLTAQDLSSYLQEKNTVQPEIDSLAKLNPESIVYIQKSSQLYSDFLADLQQKLKNYPIGIPTSGYISSLFGLRKNPIPKPKTTPTKIEEQKAEPAEVVVESGPIEVTATDSTGKKISPKVVSKSSPKTTKKAVNPTGVSGSAEDLQFHKGVDIAANIGTPIYAAANGTVLFAGEKSGYGNCVIIDHGNGLATLYGHMGKILAVLGAQVTGKTIIGEVGNTGRSTGPHLHYEVHKDGTPINPSLFFKIK